MRLPSGDQAGAASLPSLAMIRRFEPSGSLRPICAEPFAKALNARCRPSGDSSGFRSSASEIAIRCCPVPSAAIAYSWDRGARMVGPTSGAASTSSIGWAYWVKAANSESVAASPMTAGPCRRHDGTVLGRAQTERIGPLKARIPHAASARCGGDRSASTDASKPKIECHTKSNWPATREASAPTSDTMYGPGRAERHGAPRTRLRVASPPRVRTNVAAPA